MTVSVGVNTTLCQNVPAFKTVDGFEKAKVPGTLATPLKRLVADSAWPYVRTGWVMGFVLIVGTILAITKSKLLVPM